MTLTEFLLARLAEDVEEIGPASDCDCAVIGLPLRHGVRCPVPMLAECEAKRRIMDLWDSVRRDAEQMTEWPFRQFAQGRLILAEATLRMLALPYADHPDYRDEWWS